MIPLLLPFHMNLRWRESVEYFSCYAIDREKDREIERNKQYEHRKLMPFGINLIEHIYTITLCIVIE